MSKTVMIPTEMGPFWESEINGKKYAYPSGTEQTVPDEVAALIEENARQTPVENPPETSEEEIVRVATPIAKAEGAAEAAKAVAGNMKVYDFTGKTLTGSATDVTSILPMSSFAKITSLEWSAAIVFDFKYSDVVYRVRGYQVAGDDLYCFAHVVGESGITHILTLKLSMTTTKVNATLVATALSE